MYTKKHSTMSNDSSTSQNAMSSSTLRESPITRFYGGPLSTTQDSSQVTGFTSTSVVKDAPPGAAATASSTLTSVNFIGNGAVGDDSWLGLDATNTHVITGDTPHEVSDELPPNFDKAQINAIGGGSASHLDTTTALLDPTRVTQLRHRLLHQQAASRQQETRLPDPQTGPAIDSASESGMQISFNRDAEGDSGNNGSAEDVSQVNGNGLENVSTRQSTSVAGTDRQAPSSPLTSIPPSVRLAESTRRLILRSRSSLRKLTEELEAERRRRILEEEETESLRKQLLGERQVASEWQHEASLAAHREFLLARELVHRFMMAHQPSQSGQEPAVSRAEVEAMLNAIYGQQLDPRRPTAEVAAPQGENTDSVSSSASHDHVDPRSEAKDAGVVLDSLQRSKEAPLHASAAQTMQLPSPPADQRPQPLDQAAMVAATAASVQGLLSMMSEIDSALQTKLSTLDQRINALSNVKASLESRLQAKQQTQGVSNVPSTIAPVAAATVEQESSDMEEYTSDFEEFVDEDLQGIRRKSIATPANVAEATLSRDVPHPDSSESPSAATPQVQLPERNPAAEVSAPSTELASQESSQSHYFSQNAVDSPETIKSAHEYSGKANPVATELQLPALIPEKPTEGETSDNTRLESGQKAMLDDSSSTSLTSLNSSDGTGTEIEAFRDQARRIVALRRMNQRAVPLPRRDAEATLEIWHSMRNRLLAQAQAHHEELEALRNQSIRTLQAYEEEVADERRSYEQTIHSQLVNLESLRKQLADAAVREAQAVDAKLKALKVAEGYKQKYELSLQELERQKRLQQGPGSPTDILARAQIQHEECLQAAKLETLAVKRRADEERAKILGELRALASVASTARDDARVAQQRAEAAESRERSLKRKLLKLRADAEALLLQTANQAMERAQATTKVQIESVETAARLRIARLEELQAQAQAKVDGLKSELDQTKEENRNLSITLKSFEADLARAKEQLENEFKRRESQLLAAKELERELTDIQRIKDELTESLRQAEKRADDAETKLAATSRQLDNDRARLAEINQTVRTLEANKVELESALEAERQQLKLVRDMLSRKDMEHRRQMEVIRLKYEADISRARTDAIRETEARYCPCEKCVGKARAELLETRQYVRQLEESHASLQSWQSSALSALEKLAQEHPVISATLQELKATVAPLPALRAPVATENEQHDSTRLPVKLHEERASVEPPVPTVGDISPSTAHGNAREDVAATTTNASVAKTATEPETIHSRLHGDLSPNVMQILTRRALLKADRLCRKVPGCCQSHSKSMYTQHGMQDVLPMLTCRGCDGSCAEAQALGQVSKALVCCNKRFSKELERQIENFKLYGPGNEEIWLEEQRAMWAPLLLQADISTREFMPPTLQFDRSSKTPNSALAHIRAVLDEAARDVNLPSSRNRSQMYPKAWSQAVEASAPTYSAQRLGKDDRAVSPRSSEGQEASTTENESFNSSGDSLNASFESDVSNATGSSTSERPDSPASSDSGESVEVLRLRPVGCAFWLPLDTKRQSCPSRLYSNPNGAKATQNHHRPGVRPHEGYAAHTFMARSNADTTTRRQWSLAPIDHVQVGVYASSPTTTPQLSVGTDVGLDNPSNGTANQNTDQVQSNVPVHVPVGGLRSTTQSWIPERDPTVTTTPGTQPIVLVQPNPQYHPIPPPTATNDVEHLSHQPSEMLRHIPTATPSGEIVTPVTFPPISEWHGVTLTHRPSPKKTLSEYLVEPNNSFVISDEAEINEELKLAKQQERYPQEQGSVDTPYGHDAISAALSGYANAAPRPIAPSSPFGRL